MSLPPTVEPVAVSSVPEGVLLSHDEPRLEAFTAVMRLHNQRLYRVARAIVRDDAEAEDVVQEAYVSAFLNLHKFRERASLATWLTRIVIREACLRLRERRRALDRSDDAWPSLWPCEDSARTPEDATASAELAKLLERAIDHLPEPYRVIVVLRELEGLDTQEAAECLSISEETARVRLHRARALLRETLWGHVQRSAPRVFEFGGERCQRIVDGVLGRLRKLSPHGANDREFST